MNKIIFSFFILALSVSGCKKFTDINYDPNRPTAVSEKLLLAPIEYNLANNIETNDPGFAATYLNHWLQNIAYNQAIPNFGTYQHVSGNFDNPWSSIYVGGLENLSLLIQTAEKNGNSNYAGIGKILTAYCLGVATDLWGDIPYSQSLKGSTNFTPAYDKQEDIYKAIQSLLDNGLADINKNTAVKPTTDDYYYAGDMNKWKRAASTLKARYYMHLTKAPGYTAATQADLALAALQNGLIANTDDMKFSYPGGAGTENHWYNIMLPVSTIVLGSTLVDTLKVRNDPRLPVLVSQAKTDNAYRGRQIGTVGPLPNLNSFSVVGSYYGSKNSPVFILTYSEALFLKAEATLVKSGAAAAQPVYTDAVKSNMTKLGVSDGATTTYLGTRGTLTAGNALQRIMEEKSIADFLSLENYNDWRRTGFPLIPLAPNAVLPEIPRRYLYPQSEANTNPNSLQAAKLTDRVWWDTK